MIPTNRIPTHPGEILKEEFLIPMELTIGKLATHIGVALHDIEELIAGNRGITPETAWLLAATFDTTPEFWVNLQTNHDLAVHRPANSPQVLRRTA